MDKVFDLVDYSNIKNNKINNIIEDNDLIPNIWYSIYFSILKNIETIEKLNPELIEGAKKTSLYNKLIKTNEEIQTISICLTTMIGLEFVCCFI